MFYFSPIFLFVPEVISPFLFWIVLTIEENENTTLELVIYPIGYTIIIFSSLIYNEIIIFIFWELNTNTKTFVNQRMNEEIIEMNSLINDNDL